LKKLLLTTAFLVGFCGVASASEWSDRTQTEIIDLHNQIDSLRSDTTALIIQMELQKEHQEAQAFRESFKPLPPLEPSPTPLGQPLPGWWGQWQGQR
jgi:hypothetical protein